MRHDKLEGLMTPVERIARVAGAAYDAATAAQTMPSGSASFENADGTRTVIGPASGDGTMATHVGDVEPPGSPVGVAGASSAGVVYVAWGGELDGGVPADFDHVSLYVSISGVDELVGTLTEAGIVSTVPMATATTVEVWATAEDDACLADGTPAHNVSGPSARASVAVSQAADPTSVDELRRSLARALTGSREEYAVSGSRVQAPGADATWTAVPPEATAGRYVWRRTVTTYGDGTTTTSQAVPLTGESAVVVEISTTAGSTIRNNRGSTTLRATVSYGDERISDQATLEACFGAGSRLAWYPLRDGSLGDELAAPMVSDGGFSLSVSAADVAGDVTYVCELLTPEN